MCVWLDIVVTKFAIRTRSGTSKLCAPETAPKWVSTGPLLAGGTVQSALEAGSFRSVFGDAENERQGGASCLRLLDMVFSQYVSADSSPGQEQVLEIR